MKDYKGFLKDVMTNTLACIIALFILHVFAFYDFMFSDVGVVTTVFVICTCVFETGRDWEKRKKD